MDSCFWYPWQISFLPSSKLLPRMRQYYNGDWPLLSKYLLVSIQEYFPSITVLYPNCYSQRILSVTDYDIGFLCRVFWQEWVRNVYKNRAEHTSLNTICYCILLCWLNAQIQNWETSLFFVKQFSLLNWPLCSIRITQHWICLKLAW